NEPEPHGRGVDPLLEIDRIEAELVAEKLDDIVVAGDVVGLGHLSENSPAPGGASPGPSDARPTVEAMHEGTWTLRPCPRHEVRALASALGLSETTASVLVRRGYDDPDAAAAFLAATPPRHDPFLLGNVERACAAIRKAMD